MVVVPAKRARLRLPPRTRGQDPVNETFMKEPTARVLDSGSRAPGKRPAHSAGMTAGCYGIRRQVNRDSHMRLPCSLRRSLRSCT
jgi:hypothetical protein